uniref:Uncharacterized protein n=1 Tax=Brassica oleracea var. oleracea TaxID=109376 RepID=A0A0D3AV94_BRAOL
MSFFVTWLESLYSKSPRLAQTQYAGFGNHFKCHSGLLRAFHSVYGQTRVVLVRWGTFATTPLVNLRFAQTLSPDLMISTRKIFLISFSIYMKPDPNAPPKRGRGRPPKPKPEGDSSHVAVVPAPTPRPRGRPPDS